MATEDWEGKTEQAGEAKTLKPESAIHEANAGRGDLVRAQKEHAAQLKAGGASGISGAFGRLIVEGLNAISGAFGLRGREHAAPERPAVSDVREPAAQISTGMPGSEDVRTSHRAADSPIAPLPDKGGAGPVELGALIEINGRSWQVVGEDGGEVLVVRRSDTRPLGQPFAVSEQELAARYLRVGDTDYYRDEQGHGYILREAASGGRQLIPDPNLSPMARDSYLEVLAARSETDEPVLALPGSDACSQPGAEQVRAGGDTGSEAPHPSTVRINGRDWAVVGEEEGQVILCMVSHPRPLGKPTSVSESDLATRYKRVGDTQYYQDQSGHFYLLRQAHSEHRELVLDPNVAPMRRRAFQEAAGGKTPEQFPT